MSNHKIHENIASKKVWSYLVYSVINHSIFFVETFKINKNKPIPDIIVQHTGTECILKVSGFEKGGHFALECVCQYSPTTKLESVC